AIAAEGSQLRTEWANRARSLGTNTDGAVPLGYLGVALGDALDGHDWVLSNSELRGWARRLWRIEHSYQYTGTSGGAGVGYGIGASLGVGLAHKGSGRIAVNLQPDGDLLYCSSALYTAAHERLPLLTVMLNNHSYYNSEEHGLRMAEHRGRPAERAGIGTRPEAPAVDFATLARGFGIASASPICWTWSPNRAEPTSTACPNRWPSGEPFLQMRRSSPNCTSGAGDGRIEDSFLTNSLAACRRRSTGGSRAVEQTSRTNQPSSAPGWPNRQDVWLGLRSLLQVVTPTLPR
ncbi:MAG: hypothetical protein E6I52_05335, partial [Chloroflexi bacterium]